MAGGLDNLSAEGFSQLSKTINEAKELIKQQEALLQRTLSMEQQIINHRIAALREYNDEYSTMLNRIAAEQDSLRADMFSINEAGKEAAANAKKAAESLKQSQSSSNSAGNRSARQTVQDGARDRLGDADSANYENFSEKLRARKMALISEDELSEALAKREKERIKEMADAEKSAYESVLSLRLSALNQGQEASAQRAAYLNAIDDAKALQAFKVDLDRQRVELEYQARLEGEGRITAEAQARIDEIMAKRLSNEEELQKYIADYRKKQLQEEQKRREEEELRERQRTVDERRGEIRAQDQKVRQFYSGTEFSALTPTNGFFKQLEGIVQTTKEATDQATSAGGKVLTVAASVVHTIGDAISKLENQIDTIGAYKGKIDTRLQGSNDNLTYKGSYWDQIVRDMAKVGAITPYFKQEDFAKNIEDLVNRGIAFDLEQRAFLATIKDKIATTFDVADSTLLRLIRIQQQDTTAARLGMESTLNTFLNNMYENTEYLRQVSDSVRGSLEEMQALMEGAAATEVEYQVQKWMGSLYSVGMSQNAVTSITNALGQIAAGQIEGLTSGGAGNLLIMAASNAGLPITDILTKGINADETNELLQATVNYLAEIAESSKDNRVVQQQLANVFGVKASDLQAATNLAEKGSIGIIGNTKSQWSNPSYDDMLAQLVSMAGSMGQRTSTGEWLSNLWSNVTYSLAGSIASNPAAYGILKTGGLVESALGGVSIPAVFGMGTGVDLGTTIADIARVSALGVGMFSSLGSLLSGLSNSFSGSAMLEELKIIGEAGLAVTPRGDVSLLSPIGRGASTSESGMLGIVGNASGSDIQNTTMQEAEDTKSQLMVEAQENAEATQIDTINTTVLKIYELLDDVAHGNSYFRVKVESYGLTKASNGSALGGVNALSDSGIGTSGELSGGSVLSSGSGNSVNFGAWTTTM